MSISDMAYTHLPRTIKERDEALYRVEELTKENEKLRNIVDRLEIIQQYADQYISGDTAREMYEAVEELGT